MIEAITIGIFLASFFLGIKHSLDVDHIAAVSSFLVRSPKFSKTVKMSVIWALGHTLTAGIITVILFLVKDLFLTNILTYFEIVVALMLISLGILTFMWEFNVIKKKKHTHSHILGSRKHIIEETSEISNNDSVEIEVTPNGLQTKHFLGIKNDTNAVAVIGVLQGLASNDELLLLLAFTLGMNNIFIILIGIAIFSFGVMTGMISWGSIINLPGLKTKKQKIIRYLSVIIASIAIVYGIYILFGGEGINLLPI
jgi:high-affinity nickel permease